IKPPTPEELQAQAWDDVKKAGQAPLARLREETSAAALATLPEGLPPAAAVAPGEEKVAAKTAIYVHPVSVTHDDGRRLLYLDYWWYLAYNPVELGGGALCGAGLVISGVTCPSHQSDWEGVTVVVDRTGKPRLLAVQYAQHSDVVRYPWSLL